MKIKENPPETLRTARQFLTLQKLLQTLILSIIIVVGSSTKETKAWGDQDWRDSQGNPAPAGVRRLADEYLVSCEAHGEATMMGGYGHVVAQRDWNCDLCPCCASLSPPLQYHEPNGPLSWQSAHWGYFRSVESLSAKAQAATLLRQVDADLGRFRDVVNTSVNAPGTYDEVARMSTKGQWGKRGTRHFAHSCIILQGGWHDPEHLPRDTIRFVNAHGGWRAVTGSYPVARSSAVSTVDLGYGTLSGVSGLAQRMM